MRARYFVAAFVIVVVMVLAAAWASAQSTQAVIVQPVTPTVMTGGDVGFRVEGLRGGTPVGRLVVRVNGQWVEADISMLGESGRLPLPRQNR